MNTHSNYDAIKQQNRLLKSVVTIIGIFSIILIISAFKSSGTNVQHFDEIVVKKLTMIDSLGTERIRMTTDLTTAPFGGEEIERNVPPNMAAIIFIGPDGDEVGGIGYGGTKEMSFALNSLDYTGVPLEAIGYNRIQTPETSAAHFVVLDSPRKDAGFDKKKFLEEARNSKINTNEPGEQLKILQSQMVSRVNLGVENHNAALTLYDSKQNARIILKVDDNDEAVFQILDEKGNVVHQYSK
ncbi:hypothetical protein ACFSTE_04925 [Aquimarina hainanensis]|uniref:Uncharacterized protein n=1 Tax=Aquimarina hainanensis TaxID=1578017 RepID=A0ABW5N6E8_9FLAO|nr:hypothetical protein [Aquimarina sp. TRL1]QKX06164.1 hypothetical protein HN014_15010 [Aquimarina sp. TRL1]